MSEAFLESMYQKALQLGGHLLKAIVVAVVGWYIVKYLSKWCKKLLTRSHLDDSVSGFLASLISVILKIVLVLTVIATLGVEMTSISTLVASAGLAVSLSLQGCLSNFAGGVLILILKPYAVGDYIIDSDGNEGTVTSIDIIYTKLLTVDNRAVVIPNGKLADATVINSTKESKRRIDFNVSIDYSEDISKVREVLVSLAQNNAYVLQDEEISALVNKFDPSAIDIILRVWVKSENYWPAKYEIQELIKTTFDREEIVIPYDKLDVNVHNEQ